MKIMDIINRIGKVSITSDPNSFNPPYKSLLKLKT
jgi:hypothetical protein